MERQINPFSGGSPMSPTPSRLSRSVRLVAALLTGLAWPATAQLTPEWTSTLPVGTSLSSGLGDYVIDAAGNTYVTGTTGAGPFALDIVTAAYGPSGTLLWQRTFDGPLHGFDQASAIALGPDGTLYVSGDTQGVDFFASVLLVKYEAATGTLLDSVVYSSGPQTSEYGGDVAVDPQGGVYVVGGAGSDGALLWAMTNSFAYHNTEIGLALDGLGGVYVTGTVDPDTDISNDNDNIYTFKPVSYT